MVNNETLSNEVEMKTKRKFDYFLLVLIAVAVIEIIPAVVTGGHLAGFDLPYHYATIRSVNDAFNSGHFFSRIRSIIASDYGYGSGLFYSLIPSSICVLFMNLFHLPLQWALALEYFIVILCSGLVMYKFLNAIFKNKINSLVGTIVYMIFPYFLTNLFIRYAFSEVFIMLALSMVCYGLYSLIELGNYKTFIFYFTLGYVLAICTHLSVTIYITLFLAIYLLINFKKLLKDYKWFTFLVSCFLVLIISVCFYIPMLINFGVTQTNNMGVSGKSMYMEVLSSFKCGSVYTAPIIYVVILAYAIFAFTYFSRPKNERTQNEKVFFILSTITTVVVTPLFPWILAFGPFTMVQFVFRLYNINAVMIAIMAGYVIKYLRFKKALIPIFASFVVVVVALFSTGFYSANKYNWLPDGRVVEVRRQYAEYVDANLVTYFSDYNGLGANKNGDYFPKGLTQEYLNKRVNENIILDTNCDIAEIGNYQKQNLFSFIAKKSENGYVVLNIPYSQFECVELYQLKCEQENRYQNVNVGVHEGKTKLLLSDYDDEIKIVIKYEENSKLDRYLKANPFEFKVKSGSANITNFEKEWTTDYTVDIDTTVETRIELPTLFYKGYKLTYTTANGSYNLTAEHGENGFVQITLEESGTLHVEFAPKYVDVANAVSIIGICLFAIVMLLCLLVPREKFTKFGNRVTEYFKTHKNAGEILRFIIVGGIATLVDMFTMGVVMYLMQKSIYSGFLNVFIHPPTPSTLATIIGTTVGFLVGLIVNYILSILFVFNEKGNSKSAKGFMVFTLLSVVGLGINILGTFIGFDLLHLNQWLVKIVMVFVVLVYNYISKKLLLFKNKNKSKESENK